MQWISIKDQAADGLTKALDRTKFKRFRDLIGVVDCTEVIRNTGSEKD